MARTMQEMVLGTEERVGCSACSTKQAPVTYVSYHSLTWPWWRGVVSTEGNLCRDCVGTQFSRHLVLKLLGMPIGLIINPFLLAHDVVRYAKARGLPRHFPRPDAG